MYEATLTGTTPLLLHRDDVRWADAIKAWQQAPENTKYSVSGDDRSPPWIWTGRIYHDDQFVTIASSNIMTMLREGGGMILVPGGKSGKTFKSQSQSGILTIDLNWALTNGGRQIPVEPIRALVGEMDFRKHESEAERLGFVLDMRRAAVGSKKHVRVRPRFDNWAATGLLGVTDPQITADVLLKILTLAGLYKGLCDWRPSEKKSPGPFGRFSASVKEVSL